MGEKQRRAPFTPLMRDGLQLMQADYQATVLDDPAVALRLHESVDLLHAALDSAGSGAISIPLVERFHASVESLRDEIGRRSKVLGYVQGAYLGGYVMALVTGVCFRERGEDARAIDAITAWWPGHIARTPDPKVLRPKLGLPPKRYGQAGPRNKVARDRSALEKAIYRAVAALKSSKYGALPVTLANVADELHLETEEALKSALRMHGLRWVPLKRAAIAAYEKSKEKS